MSAEPTTNPEDLSQAVDALAQQINQILMAGNNNNDNHDEDATSRLCSELRTLITTSTQLLNTLDSNNNNSSSGSSSSSNSWTDVTSLASIAVSKQHHRQLDQVYRQHGLFTKFPTDYTGSNKIETDKLPEREGEISAKKIDPCVRRLRRILIQEKLKMEQGKQIDQTRFSNRCEAYCTLHSIQRKQTLGYKMNVVIRLFEKRLKQLRAEWKDESHIMTALFHVAWYRNTYFQDA